ncbi:hypothetical protein Harman_39380 [Haloarcula mannanilytica]|uniref:Halobacterial output domain-containing protein n=1 Tax=Haloarcula mannanilytica TaxID=2509225 RepID=A0A4C2ETQ3_9EURY|nr:HalOD1 output domain-containing protein [Haloarcula mannanilytica]GCF16003.1 hypothetical protein Harman_39380 [Haloarcula mannanilytica]
MEVRESETVKTAVKRVIAELEDCPMSKLGTINHCVDIDTLNAIGNLDINSADEPHSISFYYCGYEVVVYNDHTIEIAR